MKPRTTQNNQSKPSAGEIASKVVSCVLVVVIVFIAVGVLWAVIDKHVNNSPTTSFYGLSFLSVTSGSMHGTFDKGDMIVIKKVKAQKLKVGDVITFIHQGESSPTTHRIIEIVDGKFITKGDANNTHDTKPVTHDEVIGKMAFFIKGGGNFANWFLHKYGWISFVVIICGLLVASELLRRLKATR